MIGNEEWQAWFDALGEPIAGVDPEFLGRQCPPHVWHEGSPLCHLVTQLTTDVAAGR